MRKNMKKATALLIVATMAAGLSACSSGGGGETKAPSGTQAADSGTSGAAAESAPGKEKAAKTASDEKVTIRFSWWGADTRHEATLKVMNMYMEKHPNVTIEGEYGSFDSFYQKLQTQLGGGTEPDIISVDYKWVSDLTAQGELFVDMNSLTDQIDMSGFDMDFAKIYGAKGDYLIGLPVGLNGMGYLYNVEFLKQYGIEPGDDWTWETVLENGKKVQEQDPSKHLMYNHADHWVYMVKAILKQMNGQNLVKDDYTPGFTADEMAKIFDYERQLVETGTVPPFAEGVLYETVYADQNPNWLNQDLGIFPTFSSLVPGIAKASDFELATMRYPVAKDAVNPGILVTPSVFLTISVNSKHPDVAADFINYMLNDPEAISVLKDTRGIPANETAKKQLVEEGVIDGKVSTMVAQALSGAGAAENGPSLNSEVLLLLKNYIQEVGYLQMPPEEAAAEFRSELEVLLETIKP